jgi:hypothetical protein
MHIIKLILIISIMTIIPLDANAHKLISHDESHTELKNALDIPNHKTSWAIYEDLKHNQVKYYKFTAKHGDSFYSSIVIPKISALSNYAPTLVIIGDGIDRSDIVPFEVSPELGTWVFSYQGQFPSKEFYEPFGQVTYWERQEVKITIPKDGTYYIAVYDQQSNGKYSLAVGTVEDFTFVDFFTLLPKSWFDTKIFLEDYLSISIGIIFLSGITVGIGDIITKRKLNLFHKH